MNSVVEVSIVGPLWLKARAFHERYRELIMILLGVFWTAAALFLVVIATIVFAQQDETTAQHRKEAVAVKTACERSRTFGPPFIGFLSKVESREHTGELTKLVLVAGKKVEVLAFYQSTIPPSCPK